MREAAAGDAATLARALVATPSVNPLLERGGAGEAAIANLTASWLRGWGFEVATPEVAPGRLNVLARLKIGAGPSLLLNGHLDTVGVAGMAVEPFAAAVEADRLIGRGACDMKAGVAALLAAARDAAAAKSFRGELIVALTADEEHASTGMQALIASGVRADGAVVCEPTSLAIMPAHKGFAWVAVEFRGRAAHGSRPELGIDAIRHAGHFLARLAELDASVLNAPAHPLLGTGSLHAGTIAGGEAPSVYPAECRLVLERRTLPGEGAGTAAAEVEALLDRLRSEVPELDARVEEELFRPGTEIGPDASVYRALEAALADEGLPAAVRGMSAWVDAALLNEAGVPALCFGPGSIEQAHTADEWVPVDEIGRAHRVLVRLIDRFLEGEG